ncbi:hypothetical protein L1887_53088 [Cichorium endivia]|nr:hypothetical protein L1887_53088 [Cichorium endivia]
MLNQEALWCSEHAVETEVLETAACKHTGTAGAAGTGAASAALLLGLLDVDGLGLGLRVVALLRLAAVGLLGWWRVVALLGLTVTLLRLAVALLRVACEMKAKSKETERCGQLVCSKDAGSVRAQKMEWGERREPLGDPVAMRNGRAQQTRSGCRHTARWARTEWQWSQRVPARGKLRVPSGKQWQCQAHVAMVRLDRARIVEAGLCAWRQGQYVPPP